MQMLTVLNMLLKKAVEWDVIQRVPCAVRLPRSESGRGEILRDSSWRGRRDSSMSASPKGGATCLRKPRKAKSAFAAARLRRDRLRWHQRGERARL